MMRAIIDSRSCLSVGTQLGRPGSAFATIRRAHRAAMPAGQAGLDCAMIRPIFPVKGSGGFGRTISCVPVASAAAHRTARSPTTQIVRIFPGTISLKSTYCLYGHSTELAPRHEKRRCNFVAKLLSTALEQRTFSESLESLEAAVIFGVCSSDHRVLFGPNTITMLWGKAQSP